jgi:Na+-translocating ferredoxin:NAD+ oxidoreductase subunit G
MIRKAITKNGIMLALFAIAVAALLAGTEMLTREKREASIRKVQSMALEQVIPAGQRDNILLDDKVPVNDQELLKLKAPGNIYIARKDGNITAFIIPTHAPDGYSGSIHSLVGIDMAGNIMGVRVVSHNETPGLGDKIDIKKSDWALDFNHKSLSNPSPEDWHVKKDKGVFDQFTGATITPRAVVNSVRNALLFFEKNKVLLIQQATLQAASKTAGEP